VGWSECEPMVRAFRTAGTQSMLPTDGVPAAIETPISGVGQFVEINVVHPARPAEKF